MAIFGISDLHLAFSVDKPMDIFGPQWKNHADKMAMGWDATVQEEDIVLVPGDISWAMKPIEAEKDMAWIAERPGHKIFVRGNHDYWWHSLTKAQAVAPERCSLIQNNALDLGIDWVFAGSRCWDHPHQRGTTDKDRKIFERELGRLDRSLEEAQKIRNGRRLCVLLHYPPFMHDTTETAITKRIEAAQADLVVYGHLHGHASHQAAVYGDVRGIPYHLIACDFIDFKPVRLADAKPISLDC